MCDESSPSELDVALLAGPSSCDILEQPQDPTGLSSGSEYDFAAVPGQATPDIVPVVASREPTRKRRPNGERGQRTSRAKFGLVYGSRAGRSVDQRKAMG